MIAELATCNSLAGWFEPHLAQIIHRYVLVHGMASMLSDDAYGFSAESASLMFSKVHGQSFFFTGSLQSLLSLPLVIKWLNYHFLYFIMLMIWC